MNDFPRGNARTTRFYIDDVHGDVIPLAEVFAEDALGALTVYARDHGYAGYERGSDYVSVDLPDVAIAVFENTELRARRA